MTSNTNASTDSTTAAADDDTTFPVALDDMRVGDTAGLITFETRDGYGRIAIKKTERGASDVLVLQRPGHADEPDHVTIDEIARVGRWFARGDVSWDDIPS